MDAFSTRSVSQRKRSHSTTAYSTSLLAAAAGSQVLTYEFINTQAIQPPANATPGQYEAIQTSNERTEFGVSSLKWSPDNKMLAVEAVDGRIWLHDNRGQFQEALVDEPVMDASGSASKRCVLSWTPKAQRLYFANHNRVMNWDPTSQRIAETLEMSSRIDALAINNGDILLAIGQNTGSVDVVNRTTGVMTRLDTPPSLVISKLEYSVFSRALMGSIGNDSTLRLWDTGPNGSTSVYHSFTTTHAAPISDMAFSPTNPYLICTAGLDKHYALYDVEKKTVAMTVKAEYGLTSVAFKNENNQVAFGTVNGKVLLYDLRSPIRPIVVVDTRVDSPVAAIHFQGKQSSPSIKRHQTAGEYTVKNPTGSQSSSSSAAPIKGSITSSKTLPLPASEDMTRNVTESTPVRPPLIKTSSTGHASLSQSISGNGASHSTREVQSAGVAGKSILDLFTAKPNTGLSGLSVMTGQDRAFHKSRQTAPSPISTTIPTQSMTRSGRSTPGGLSSVPTTPAKESAGQLGSNFTNSRATSPYTFRGSQRHRPSADYDEDEDSSMSSSPAHTPPGSPGGGGARSSKNNQQRQHNHLLAHKSPSRSLGAKSQSAFGMLGSGKRSSASSSIHLPDILSDENMEVLGSRIVSQVQSALVDQDEPMGSLSRAATSSSYKPARRATSAAALPSSLAEAIAGVGTGAAAGAIPATATPRPKSRGSVKDLWLQVGSENGESSKRPSSPLSTNTRSSLLAHSVLPNASSSMSSGLMDTQHGGGSTTGTLQTKILEGVVEDCLMNFRAGIRNDIQNMHLELLRQFQIQKMEIEGMLKRYTDTKELKEEIERLKEENQRLRMNY
ncbi:MAG: WD40-repeat-containing domain protein [Benniella sp.]|nr:MAG: WD40-repeat-containing domain protein [Benniella sp.]